jgi:hypothetical protein
MSELLLITVLCCTVVVALYANYKTTETALRAQQLANKRLTDLTRQLALLAKSPDVVIGQGAIEVDRQNTLLMEQEALRIDKTEPPSAPAPEPEEKIVKAGNESFKLVGASPEEEAEFLANLGKN